MRENLKDIEHLRVLGDHLMGIGAYPQAAKAYYRAITHRGEALSIASPVHAAHLHARMASALLSDDLFLEANPYASEAMALDDSDPYVRYVHAFLLHSEGSDGEALDGLDSLAANGLLQPWVNVARAAIDPASVDANVLKGILTEALSRNPTIGALHARLSVVCEATGDFIDSVEHARIAAWLQQSLLRRWRRYGDVAMRAGAYSSAVEAYDSAREVSPFDPRIDALVARAHFAGGDIDQAAGAALRGLWKNPGHSDCLRILDHLKRPGLSGSSAVVRLETDSDVPGEAEPFIFVPPWPQMPA